jgi:hypothetical protein
MATTVPVLLWLTVEAATSPRPVFAFTANAPAPITAKAMAARQILEMSVIRSSYGLIDPLGSL